jgi:hypothetical protein
MSKNVTVLSKVHGTFYPGGIFYQEPNSLPP